MSKESIIKDLENNKSGVKTRENYIRKHYPTDYELIIKISFTDKWVEKLYVYLYNIKSKPKCLNENCSNEIVFKKFSNGYNSYCSIYCRNTDKNMLKSTRENILKKYGVDNPMKYDKFKSRSKETKRIRYGDEQYNNVNKAKKTKKNKYGDENYSNRLKAVETNRNNNGVDNYGNRNKAKLTMLNRYGVEHYSQTKDWLNKVKFAYNNKDLVELNEINEKRKLTMNKLYGSDYYSQSNISKIKCYSKTIKNIALKLSISVDDISYDGDLVTIRNYCSTHNEFQIGKYVLKNRLLYGINDICTKCNVVSDNSSIKELELMNFVKSLVKSPTKHSIDNKEIDIFIPEHNIGIEFNGLYWHSNKFVNKDYHLNKTEVCERNNIQLLHVFENEWIYKKEIVKSIIKSKLNIFERKLYARKCVVKMVSPKDSKTFLNENHIQGSVNSSIKIGLYLKDELVSLMTFGRKRIALGFKKSNNNNDYELLRFCNKKNVTVIGGASKLLKYFIRSYSPDEIITYADRRYSNGNLYINLGFDFINNTKPNYWYFKSHEYQLHHRFKFRKDRLMNEGYDHNKTELQIMAERGYYRIFDSGNMKFMLKFPVKTST
jgi:hypothetical protein